MMFHEGFGRMGSLCGRMGGGLFGVFAFLLFLAAVAALIVWLVRRTRVGHEGVSAVTQGHVTRTGAAEALRELELRYARGEVSRDEFLRIKDDLVS